MRRSFPLRAFRLALVSCAVLSGGLVFSAAQALATEGKPMISSESVTGITEHGATLDAQINPDGLETKYEFWIEYAVCQPIDGDVPCEAIAVKSVGSGYITASDAYTRVSASLANLDSNYSYTYWVLATNSAGWAEGSSKEFKAVNTGGTPTEGNPLPPPENTPTPLERPGEAGVGSSAQEGLERELAKARQQQQEREAAEAAANRMPPPPPIPTGAYGCVIEPGGCGGGGVSLAGTSIAVQRNGIAPIRLDCKGSASCEGELTLSVQTTSKAKSKKKRSRTITIGIAKFSITAGKTQTVRIMLNTAARSLLSADRGRLTVHLAILQPAPAPEHTQTTNVHLTEQKSDVNTKQ